MTPPRLGQLGSSSPAATPGGAGGELLGIEIGGTKLQIVAGDKGGAITRRWRATVRPDEGGDGVRRQIREGLDEMRRAGTPAAIGVGFGGPIDWRTGRIARSYQLGGWEGFDLAGWLTEAAGGAAVAVENDANAGALGEAARGAGAGLDPVFYVTLGSGVGGGLVAGGKIYHGAPPGEAEFGHLRLGRDQLGGDGTATVESRCSGWAVDRRIRRLKEQGSTGQLARSIGATPGGEAKHLAAALRAGDADARQILDDVAADLAFALSHAVHLLHPQVIVLGGGLSLIGEPLRAAVAERLPALVMQAFHPVPDVRLAALGEDAVPVGALETARRRLHGLLGVP